MEEKTKFKRLPQLEEAKVLSGSEVVKMENFMKEIVRHFKYMDNTTLFATGLMLKLLEAAELTSKGTSGDVLKEWPVVLKRQYEVLAYLPRIVCYAVGTERNTMAAQIKKTLRGENLEAAATSVLLLHSPLLVLCGTTGRVNKEEEGEEGSTHQAVFIDGKEEAQIDIRNGLKELLVGDFGNANQSSKDLWKFLYTVVLPDACSKSNLKLFKKKAGTEGGVDAKTITDQLKSSDEAMCLTILDVKRYEMADESVALGAERAAERAAVDKAFTEKAAAALLFAEQTDTPVGEVAVGEDSVGGTSSLGSRSATAAGMGVGGLRPRKKNKGGRRKSSGRKEECGELGNEKVKCKYEMYLRRALAERANGDISSWYKEAAQYLNASYCDQAGETNSVASGGSARAVTPASSKGSTPLLSEWASDCTYLDAINNFDITKFAAL